MVSLHPSSATPHWAVLVAALPRSRLVQARQPGPTAVAVPRRQHRLLALAVLQAQEAVQVAAVVAQQHLRRTELAVVAEPVVLEPRVLRTPQPVPVA